MWQRSLYRPLIWSIGTAYHWHPLQLQLQSCSCSWGRWALSVRSEHGSASFFEPYRMTAAADSAAESGTTFFRAALPAFDWVRKEELLMRSHKKALAENCKDQESRSQLLLCCRIAVLWLHAQFSKNRSMQCGVSFWWFCSALFWLHINAKK